ncbi:MAG: periplasmic heavy metal sensor [Bacteroidales bacterium]|nr:periplasmic heavy metal sensor [Bacteroidales bacterium]
MKTKVLFLSVLFLSSIFVGHLSAQQQRDYQNRNWCLIDDLSEEQIVSIDAIRLESESKVREYRAELDIKRAELRKLRIANNPSETTIHQKIEEMSVLNTKIRKENASKRIAVRSELTPEQREVYDARISSRNYNSRPQMRGNRNYNCRYQSMDSRPRMSRGARPMGRNQRGNW